MRTFIKSFITIILVVAAYLIYRKTIYHVNATDHSFSNTPETSTSINWLTFQDQNLPYTIQYSSNCLLDNKNNSTTFRYFINGNESIFSISFEKGKPLEEVASFIRKSRHDRCTKYKSSIIIDGITSQKMDCEEYNWDAPYKNIPIKETHYLIPKNDDTYIIYISHGRDLEKNSLYWGPIFNRMIASFRIVPVSPIKSEWSQYNSPDKHFSILYPTAWHRSGGFNGAADEVSFEAFEPGSANRDWLEEYFKVMVFRDPEFKNKRDDIVTDCLGKPIIIDGKNANQCKYWKQNIVYFLEENGKSYGLVLGYKTNKDILEKMLESFHFQ